MAQHHRIINWGTTAELIVVLDPVLLTPRFGIPERHHILTESIKVVSGSTGRLIITNDPHNQLGKFHLLTTAQARADITDKQILQMQPALGNSHGLDSLFYSNTSGGLGFAETDKDLVQWDVTKNLVFARDTNVAWTIQIAYDIVPGPMSWDILSETNKIRQSKNIQTTAGGIWFQPNKLPGEAYHQTDLEGIDGD